MTREKKIDKIYEVIANKELSMGCVVYCDDYFDGTMSEVVCSEYNGKIETNIYPMEVRNIKKIKGHPVMIGDVLEWYDKNTSRDYSGEASIYCDQVMKMTGIWSNKKLSINSQEDSCIDFIYSLIYSLIEQGKKPTQ